jgi:hypothetical protein
VTLYGPTNFSPIIKRIANAARQCQDGLNYFILLIVTDGVITDVEATRAAVVNVSDVNQPENRVELLKSIKKPNKDILWP